jgi:hypothetical protein
VQGDDSVTLTAYLHNNLETIVALAYFDFDLFKPTPYCLEALLPYLTKGGVLAFDELKSPEFPDETIAVCEVLGLARYAIWTDPSNPLTFILLLTGGAKLNATYLELPQTATLRAREIFDRTDRARAYRANPPLAQRPDPYPQAAGAYHTG